MKQITAKHCAKIHPLSARSARESADSEHHLHQHDPVRPGERLQLARPAGAVRKMIHGLRPVPQRHAQAAVRRASGAGSSRRGRGLLRPRQHQRRGASRRPRGAAEERATKHRQLARRMVREDPHGPGKGCIPFFGQTVARQALQLRNLANNCFRFSISRRSERWPRFRPAAPLPPRPKKMGRTPR